jgi:hypothetical protein
MAAAQTKDEFCPRAREVWLPTRFEEALYPTSSLPLILRNEFKYCTSSGVAEHTSGHFYNVDSDLLAMDE